MNLTLEKFGYPDSIIHSYEHWTVLLRPQQITLGALILGSNDKSTRFSDVPLVAMEQLAPAIRDIESTLTNCFNYDKINYLMLMMVDPHVHFHVVPRYESVRDFASVSISDPGWPGPPDLGKFADLTAEQHTELLNYMREHWVA